nr:ribonuclease H-like domain-containing protein [Tanacetum cinerariifolium]
MESLNPQVVDAAKLPILNPNEFDFWNMRIEQYFLLIDYSIWEVILNGDSFPPTRIVDGVVQIEDINLKFLRSLPLEWKTYTLIWRNKADLEEQSLDDLFNNLKIYEAEVKGLSTSSQNIQNIAFVSTNNTDNTTESVNVVPSVSAASSKAKVSTLPNVDSHSDAVIYSFFAIGGYDWSFQAEEEPTNYALMAFTSPGSLSSLGSDKNQESDTRVTENQENDRYKTGEGYHVVPPLYTVNFLPPKPELVFTDDTNASESVANVINVKSSKHKTRKDKSKTHRPDAPIIEYWISDSKDETKIEYVPKQREPNFVKSTVHVKTSRESVKKVKHNKQAKNLRTNNQKSKCHKNNWKNKAWFVCRSFNHLIKDCDHYERKIVQKPVWNSAMRVSHQNSVSLLIPIHKGMLFQTSVLTRSRLVSLNAARPVTTVVTQSTMKCTRPVKNVLHQAYSPIRRPINQRIATKNSNFNKVTTVKVNKVNVVQGKRVILKKPQYAGCGNQNGNQQQALQDKGVIDGGCSRYMTGNISFLLEFKEINGGYVAFGGNSKGGKISSKGKIKTGKLDFDDVYFFKELKFNLFSVSQICDKKNSVLFTDTECVVLSSNYKLLDENHVLLRVPRENNMYNVDLKNVVPSGGLACLFAKATLDESNL